MIGKLLWTAVAHESVLEAAVIGVPDDNSLVKPEAFVAVEPGVLAGEEPARAPEAGAAAWGRDESPLMIGVRRSLSTS
jgi:hypothetical protein